MKREDEISRNEDMMRVAVYKAFTPEQAELINGILDVIENSSRRIAGIGEFLKTEGIKNER